VLGLLAAWIATDSMVAVYPSGQLQARYREGIACQDDLV
jgi:hypothetical protein